MAALVGRTATKPLLRATSAHRNPQAHISMLRNLSKGKKYGLLLGGMATAAGATLAVAIGTVGANDPVLEPPHFPWNHSGHFQSFDAASARRGYEVYKQVCAACHSLNNMYYRELAGHIMSKDRAKKEAAEITVKDGPDLEGNYFDRPGKLYDRLPAPYDTPQAAAAANNGAEPPDLSYMVNAREEAENYVFSLLTGYCDPPGGVTLGEGQYYNPYFEGGAIAMAPPLYNEIIEYEDGTPATMSQLAKDVITFLKFTAEYEHDRRKEMGLKAMMCMVVFWGVVFYTKKFRWSYVMTRKRHFWK